MITNQTVNIDGNKIKLRNTFDIGTAKRIAQETTQQGGGRTTTMRCMGYIPPEMWLYDPWLLQARKAQAAGDKQEYTEMVKKFFEVHPALQVRHERKYFSGVTL